MSIKRTAIFTVLALVLASLAAAAAWSNSDLFLELSPQIPDDMPCACIPPLDEPSNGYLS